MTWEYSEDNLIEQTAIDLFFNQLGWVIYIENQDAEVYFKREGKFRQWAIQRLNDCLVNLRIVA